MYSTMYPDLGMSSDMSTLFMTVLGAMAAYLVFVIAIVVVLVIANWKIFSKAGKPGWASIIPIYNTIVKFEIVGLSPWLILLYLVPFVNVIAVFVLNIMVSFRLAKSFGKDIGWGFGLWLLPYVFNLILAFGSSEYFGPNGEVKF